jgi:hypothetical protein
MIGAVGPIEPKVGELMARAFLLLDASVSFVFGVGWLLAPGLVLGLFGIEERPATSFVGQLLGTLLLTLAAILWLNREEAGSTAGRRINMASLVPDVLAAVVSLWAVLGGVTGPLGWLVVGIFVVVAVARSYFLFIEPRTSR